MTRHSFTCNIIEPETGIVLFPDFECEIEVRATVSGGQLDYHCRDVLVDGVSLDGKSALAQQIRYLVLELADADVESAGRLWDAVADAEGISVRDAGGPDARFVMVA